MSDTLLSGGFSMKSVQTNTFPFFIRETLLGNLFDKTKSWNVIFFSLSGPFPVLKLKTTLLLEFISCSFPNKSCCDELMIIPSEEVGKRYSDLSTNLFLICSKGLFPEERMFLKNL